MFRLTTVYTTFVFRKKSWIAFTVRGVCSFETVIIRGHFPFNGEQKTAGVQKRRSSKLGHQDSYPDYFSRRRLNSVALWSTRIKCLFKNQILNHQGRLSLPRWKGRKLLSSYLPTWVWFMPLPISVSIPSSLSTQLLNTEHDRVKTKNLAESSLFCGYLWTLALKF